jgi:hypothetical protein
MREGLELSEVEKFVQNFRECRGENNLQLFGSKILLYQIMPS